VTLARGISRSVEILDTRRLPAVCFLSCMSTPHETATPPPSAVSRLAPVPCPLDMHRGIGGEAWR